MKKLLFISLFIFIIFLTACAMGERPSYDNGDNSSTPPNQEEMSNVEERKIIYKVSANLTTDNLAAIINKIHANLETGEWFDEESINEEDAYLVVRVKSSRLDSFLNFLSTEGDVNNLNKKATDVSLSYQDISNKITSLQAERDRLVDLYEKANINDMINIDRRITEVDEQLGELNGTLIQYDQLIDYSEVKLNIYQEGSINTKSFGDRIVTTISGSWDALVAFVQAIIILITAILPFLLIIGPITGIIIFLARYKKRKIQKR